MSSSWEGLVRTAITANEQLEFQVRTSKQMHDCFGKLLWASRMTKARLLEEQRMLRHMLHQANRVQGHPSALKSLPDMHPPWQQQFASPASEFSKDELQAVLQELKDLFSSFIAAGVCHETWQKLDPLLAKLPAPQPEMISGPGAEQVPWPQRPELEGKGMEASALPLQSPAAMRARLLPAPEIFCSMTAVLPKAGDSVDNFRSASKGIQSFSSMSSYDDYFQ